jgi:hypothetical protein
LNSSPRLWGPSENSTKTFFPLKRSFDIET